MTSAAVLVERARQLGLPPPPPTCPEPHKWDKDCLPCRRRSKWSTAVRDTAKAHGLWEGLVDVAPAVEHMRNLHDNHGMSYRHQATLAGLPTRSVWGYLNGVITKVQPDTRDRILALQPPPVEAATGDRNRLHSAGTRRRLDDLALRGFSKASLAARYGVRLQSVQQWGSGPYVTVEVHERVKELHADLEGQTGTSKLTADRANAKGYLPLYVWGDRVDDPTAEPDLTARPPVPDGPVEVQDGAVVWVGRVLIDPASVRSALREDVPTPDLTAAELIEAVRAGSVTPWPGLSANQLAALLGSYKRHINRIRERLALAEHVLTGTEPITLDRGRTDWVIYLASLPAPYGWPTPMPTVADRLGLPLELVERHRRRVLTNHRLPRTDREET